MRRKITLLLGVLIMLGVTQPTGVQAQKNAIRNSVEGRNSAKGHEFYTISVVYINTRGEHILGMQRYGIIEGESITVLAPEIEGYHVLPTDPKGEFIEFGKAGGCYSVTFIYIDTPKTEEQLQKEKEKIEKEAADKLKEEERVKEEKKQKEEADIKQEAEDKEARIAQFVDVKRTDWFVDDLDKAVKLYIISGIAKNNTEVEFRPNDTLNHAQLYNMLASVVRHRRVEVPQHNGRVNWYTASSLRLKALGLIDEIKDDTEILKGVTRLETVELLTRIAELEGLKGVDISKRFTDTGDVNKPMIDIIKGYSDGTYGIDDILTRAQAVAMFSRTLELLGR